MKDVYRGGDFLGELFLHEELAAKIRKWKRD
jgi:hypothetical protein